MFVRLLIPTFVAAVMTSTVAAMLFAKPVDRVVGRLVSDELAPIWQRYVLFAVCVAGIPAGEAGGAAPR
jgi:hypothetical protein